MTKPFSTTVFPPASPPHWATRPIKFVFTTVFTTLLKLLNLLPRPRHSILSSHSSPLTPRHRYRLAVLVPAATKFIIAAILFTAYTAIPVQAQSRYVTISYTTPSVLKEFNENLSLGRSLSRMIKRKNIVTIEDEVYAKVDIIVEKVEVVLDMFPQDIRFNLVLVPTKREVAAIYQKNYGKKVNHIAYYSLSQKTIYLSVDDTRLRVLAHEIGHMIVDHFFKVRPPYNIHELMAQFAEKHVTD